MAVNKKRIVIIGGGPAGLTAAHELLRDGGNERFDVTLLEESGEFGGISRTVRHNGNRMDIGGHRFFSKDERVMNWWRDILPLQGAPSYDDKKLGRSHELEPGGPDPETCDRVMLKRHRVSRIYWNGKFFDYPVSLKPATLKSMGFAQTMRVGFSYLGSLIHKLPEDNLENFYINRFGRTLYSMFFEGYTEKLWGRHPSVISADWGSQRVKGISITAVLKDALQKAFGKKDASKVETSLIEEFWYPKYGPGQLWETVADIDEKLGCSIVKHAHVNSLKVKDGQVASLTYLDEHGANHVVSGDEFISSMPLKDLVAAMEADTADAVENSTGKVSDSSQPVIPERVRHIAEGLPYRDFVTVGLLVDHLNLKNETDIPTLGSPSIVPDCWIYVQDSSVKVGRIQIFNNWSPYLVADVDHKVWIGLEYFCDEGDDFWNMSEQDCTDFAVAELVKMGVISNASNVLDSHREKVKKAYPAYFDTWYQIDELVDWLDGYGNLWCTGRNGQHRYNNMDHSMATAFEAVADIKAGIRDKKNVWSVNTDKGYHEEK